MDEEARYCQEVSLVDSLIEFHPSWLRLLTSDQIRLLDNYYGIISNPQDLEAWRNEHVWADRICQTLHV